MKLKKNIAISETGFVFDPTTGDSYTLNPIGYELLDMIRKGHTKQEVSTHFLSKYDVDETTFERYYYDFLSTLKHMQLIESHE